MISFSYTSEPVFIASGGTRMAGVLELPRSPCGIVLLAQEAGAGSRHLHGELRRAGLATLLLSLHLETHDDGEKPESGLEILCARLAAAADWLAVEPKTMHLALGVHGSGTGGAAAVQVAASRPERIAAVVLRGGRPDLATADTLARVRAPTLLIVGEQDGSMIECNRRALQHLSCEKDLAVVRGTTDANASPRTLDETAQLAARWFRGYFGGGARPADGSAA